MKFSPKILTLFTLTTAYAYSINVNNKLNARASADEEFKFARECKQNLSPYYNECIPFELDSFSLDKLNATCEKMTSPKCQPFLEKPSNVTNCNKVESVDLSYIEQFGIISKIICTKNEQNEFCPFSKLETFSEIEYKKTFFKKVPTEEEVMKVVNETCNSRKCYEALSGSIKYDTYFGLKYYEVDDYGKENNEDIFSIKGDNYCFGDECKEIKRLTSIIQDQLKSKECKAYSGANTIKINYTLLLISLVLMLSFF